MSGRRRIYLDHAATSWPKPAEVLEATQRFAQQCGAAAGRGSYRSSLEAGSVIASLRRKLAEQINAESPKCVSFHPSGTAALNAAIHGLVREGDHVVTTAAEHNSVLRPLHHLQQTRGVHVTIVPCESTGQVERGELLAAVREETRLVAVTHASNVTGAVNPIGDIGRGLRDHPAALLCDAAQTFGYLPIDVQAMGIDLLAAPGHKGGRGPFGTGMLYVGESLHEAIVPWMQGGTGSDSDSLQMPAEMPEKLEAGILNIASLAGWLAGLQGAETGVTDEDNEQRGRLRRHLLTGLADLRGVRVIAPPVAIDHSDRRELLPIASLQVEGLAPADLAGILDADFGIEVRAGWHCAALIHRYLQTEPEGTLRVSAGHTTSDEEIDTFHDALQTILSSLG